MTPSLPAIYIDSDVQTAKAFTYAIPSFGLDDGTFVFSYLGYFLSYITAHEVTVGETNSEKLILSLRALSLGQKCYSCFCSSIVSLDMLREAIHTKLSIEEFVLEVINPIFSRIIENMTLGESDTPKNATLYNRPTINSSI